MTLRASSLLPLIGDERLMPHRPINGLAVASLAPYHSATIRRKIVDDTVDRRVALALVFALAAGIAPFPAFGQGKYPENPIRLIVPRSAGGVVDIIGRQWAERVRTSIGSVFVENIGGGGGTIGTSAAAHASPNGYTLVIGSTSDLVLNPVLMPNLTYDATKDFVPVSIMAISVGAIIVNAALPVKTLPELVAFAKANPGKLSYGSAGAGTMANLAGEMFKQLTGLPEIVHIPYKGAAPGLADLVAGHIPMVAATISEAAIELHNSGKVRILVAASDQRITAVPDVPTSAEAGYPGFIAQLFMGLFAPAGTPKPIIDQLAKATHEVMADKDFQSKLTAQGYEPVVNSDPTKAAEYMQEERARWTSVLKASGMKTN
ncbi:Bug family tripartite tricarboxylate transporter substrate binding protein [Pseudorhodoplanes sinuspersici]|nr:tripartite tricarboxylate transporter substrate binding protein [Pseudorhodoplanes sinuspersici]